MAVGSKNWNNAQLGNILSSVTLKHWWSQLLPWRCRLQNRTPGDSFISEAGCLPCVKNESRIAEETGRQGVQPKTLVILFYLNIIFMLLWAVAEGGREKYLDLWISYKCFFHVIHYTLGADSLTSSTIQMEISNMEVWKWSQNEETLLTTLKYESKWGSLPPLLPLTVDTVYLKSTINVHISVLFSELPYSTYMT